jgi:hypothetical protein
VFENDASEVELKSIEDVGKAASAQGNWAELTLIE